MKVVFLDRDGTLICEPPDQQVDSLEKLEMIPGVFTGLHMLHSHDYKFVMVTNQDALGSTAYPREKYDQVQKKLLRLLEGEGIRFGEIFICPHTAADACECRKPKTGLVDTFLAINDIDRGKSFMIGDRLSDVEFGSNIGCKTILITGAGLKSLPGNIRPDYRTHDFLDACRYILKHDRHAVLRRKTNETEIDIEISLDGTGSYRIDSGVGFFDHMLEQVAKHSSIDIAIKVVGDLKVDEHHTVEDTGLALGEAIRSALGNKRGIDRYGFLLPMDESLARVALDLSGRPYFAFEGGFERERVGDLPTELVEDFFRAFADGLRANLHIQVTGRNDHHKIEAIFKSVARALKQAVSRSLASDAAVPSTKGIL